jgi:hypothetical protein
LATSPYFFSEQALDQNCYLCYGVQAEVGDAHSPLVSTVWGHLTVLVAAHKSLAEGSNGHEGPSVRVEGHIWGCTRDRRIVEARHKRSLTFEMGEAPLRGSELYIPGVHAHVGM